MFAFPIYRFSVPHFVEVYLLHVYNNILIQIITKYVPEPFFAFVGHNRHSIYIINRNNRVYILFSGEPESITHP